MQERLAMVRPVIPRIMSPYEETNLILVNKHEALGYPSSYNALKKVKLPPMISAMSKGYVKEIDEEYKRREAAMIELAYKEYANRNPHLLVKKKIKFKKRRPSHSDDLGEGTRRSEMISVNQPLNSKGVVAGTNDLYGGSNNRIHLTNDSQELVNSKGMVIDEGKPLDNQSNLLNSGLRNPQPPALVEEKDPTEQVLRKAKEQASKDNKALNIRAEIERIKNASHEPAVQPQASNHAKIDQSKKTSDEKPIIVHDKKPEKPITTIEDDRKVDGSLSMTDKTITGIQAKKEIDKKDDKIIDKKSNDDKSTVKPIIKDQVKPIDKMADGKDAIAKPKKPKTKIDDLPDDFFGVDEKPSQSKVNEKKPEKIVIVKDADVKNSQTQVKKEEPKKDDIDDFFGDFDNKATKKDASKQEPAKNDVKIAKTQNPTNVKDTDSKIAKAEVKTKPSEPKNELDDFFGDTPAKDSLIKPAASNIKETNKKIDDKKESNKTPAKPKDDIDDLFGDVPKKEEPIIKPTKPQEQTKKPEKVQEKPVEKANPIPKGRLDDDEDDFFGDFDDKKKQQPEKSPAPTVKPVEKIIEQPKKAQENKDDAFDDFFNDDKPKAADQKKPIDVQAKKDNGDKKVIDKPVEDKNLVVENPLKKSSCETLKKITVSNYFYIRWPFLPLALSTRSMN